MPLTRVKSSLLKPETITDFSGGMTNAIRSGDLRYASTIKHFDCLSAKNKLIPYVQMKADGSVGTTESLALFLSAGTSSTTVKQYALGVVSGTSRAQVFERASLPTGAWTASTTATSSSGARSEKLFVLYKDSSNNQVIFGAKAGTTIWSYRPDNNTFNEAGGTGTGVTQDLTYTNIAQGIVHSKDDVLYIPYDNKIAKYNAGTPAWTTSAITFPSTSVITSICEYGNYIAVATKPLFMGGRSTVYLWDRDASLTTLSEKIDFGTEDLELIQELEGELIGISTTSLTSNSINTKVVFKKITSKGAKQFLEIPIDTPAANGITIGYVSQKQNNRIYFPMGIRITPTGGTAVEYRGIWTLGRIGDNELALSLDRLANGDTAISGSYTPLGFQLLGDYMTLAYKDGASTFVTNRTDDVTTNFTNSTSIYETIKINDGFPTLTKKLIRAEVLFEPFIAGGQIVLKYRKDNETVFTTIFTFTTTTAGALLLGREYTIITVGNTDFTAIGATSNAIGQLFVATGAGTGTGIAVQGITSYGVNFITNMGDFPQYEEIIFRIESTGNAKPVGLKWQSSLIDEF